MYIVKAQLSTSTQLFWKHKTHAHLIIIANVSITVDATENNFLLQKDLKLRAGTTSAHVHGLIITVGRFSHE